MDDIEPSVSEIARAWRVAAHAQENLTVVQTRCTELIQEARALKLKLARVRTLLRVIEHTRFTQRASSDTMHTQLIEILDDAS